MAPEVNYGTKLFVTWRFYHITTSVMYCMESPLILILT